MNLESHTSGSSFHLTPKRIEGLQDGVFAIVMTLLVLEMHVPEAKSGPELRHALAETLPILITYVMTFVNLGIYWVGQQIQFQIIERSDRVFAWIHVLFLMFVSLLPFTSAILGKHSFEQTASLVYGLNLIAIGITSYAGWAYASRYHRLTTHDISDELVESVKRRILVAPVAALVAILLSFFSMTLSNLCYLIILPYYIFPGQIDRFWQQRAVPHKH